MSFDARKIRADFPILEREIKGRRMVFLDSAASSQKPTSVLEAMDTYYETINANVHRGVYEIAEAATNAMENARVRVGRFIGAFAMRTVKPEHALAFAGAGAFLVMLVATFATGQTAMWALISVGLFHSIMFPTIFTLGIRGLGPLTEEGSGLLVMAIAGGALVIVQGWIADRYGLQTSFLLTAACEIYIIFYALWGSRVPQKLPEQKAV